MDRTRTASPLGTPGSVDVGGQALHPAHVDGHTPHVAHKPIRARRSWLKVALRVVRDAAVAVALLATVPVIIVATQGERIWGGGNWGFSVRTRMKQVQVVRPFVLPADPSITAMQAGRAFAALGPTEPSAAFPEVQAAPTRAVTAIAPAWETATLTPDMFVSAAPDMYRGPSSRSILEAVAKGFTPKEMDYLRTLATAPAWREFDLVARAPTMDFIGARFKVPFAPNAATEAMPVPRYKTTREMAYAAVSRAAYHVALGHRDSAETVLRSIISFGFVLIDNGTSLIDELMGNVAVGVGRDALQRFYVITHDPRAGAPALAQMTTASWQQARAQGGPQPLDVVRRRLIAQSADPSIPRGERFEALRLLSTASCTNVPELLFGPRRDVENAFRDARANLARFPSEQALVDLIHRDPRPNIASMSYDPIQSLALSASTVAGVVLRNPRMAACSRIVGGYYGPR